MNKLKVAVLILAVTAGLTGCGKFQKMQTTLGGHTKVCIDHSIYIIFNTGAVQQRDIDTDKLVRC